MIAEREGHGLSQVLNRRDLFEDLFKTGNVGDVGATFRFRGFDARFPRVITQQPIEALNLQAEEVRGLEGFAELRE